MSSDFVIQLGLHQLQLLKGDITAIAVDVIVNAANAELAGGGGVDGAIHRAGGPEIMRELGRIRARIGRCEPGCAVATGAGNLPANYVFHAVGPIYRDGKQGEAETLASCYRTCLQLAAERGVRTISFPSISTGVYGYPIGEAAEIAVRTVAGWLHDYTEPVHVVKLIQFSDRDHAVYREHAQNCAAMPPAPPHTARIVFAPCKFSRQAHINISCSNSTTSSWRISRARPVLCTGSKIARARLRSI